MPIEVSLAIAASVLMHVAWNLMARHQPRDAEPLWWVLLAHAVLLGPWGLYCLVTQVQWNTTFVALLCTSAIANAAYFYGLARAYNHAPVALVYPLVRSSPLLIAIWSLFLFSERLSALAYAGIALSVAGLLLMALTGRNSHEGRAMPWAFVAMLATSVYSLSDKAATVHVSTFGGLMGYITVGYLTAWSMMSVRMRLNSGRWMPRARLGTGVMIGGGLCIGTAYALIIHAMRSLPAAEVVAYSNAGIVIATLSSIVIFKERTHWRWRCGAVLVICAGLVILAIGRSRGA